MRRPSREISIFNLSMLDVICSALGAVLILLILAHFEQQSAQADLQAKDEQLEKLIKKMMELDQQLEEEKRRPGAGMAVGMCETDAAEVTARIFDHGSVDGDRVDFTFNREPYRQNVSLPGKDAPLVYRLALKPGANYLGAHALDEGASPPNTATVVIEPCLDGNAEVFRWDMSRGQQRHISIVRSRP